MTSGMEDRHATDPTSKRRESLFVFNHHHLWLSRCSVLRSSSPSSFPRSLVPSAPSAFSAFCHPRPPPPSALAPSCRPCYKAGALKAAAVHARNRAEHSGKNPPDVAHMDMKIATTTTTTMRILLFRALSRRTTWTFLRKADPALCPVIAQPSR